jgi:hypothetical protein
MLALRIGARIGRSEHRAPEIAFVAVPDDYLGVDIAVVDTHRSR